MGVKSFLIVCASALLVQSSLSQCMGHFGPYRSGLIDEFALDGIAYGPVWPGRYGYGGLAPAVDIIIASSLNAAYGGCLPITSASASAPTGLAVTSDNAYEGPVAVAGSVPFLGTADVEGVFPTVGVSAISYGCGDGVVAITAEGPIEAAYAPAAIAPVDLAPTTMASTIAPCRYKGFPGRGCGCGAPYIY